MEEKIMKAPSAPAFLTCFMALVMASGCQSRDQGPLDTADEVRRADAELQAAVAAKDLEKVMSYYAEDASLLPAASPLVEGWQAIREEWSHIFAIPGLNSAGEMTRVLASGNLAYTQGRYTATMNGPGGDEVVEHGKWVTVWHRQSDGTWKVIADIYNTDTLPPEHL